MRTDCVDCGKKSVIKLKMGTDNFLVCLGIFTILLVTLPPTLQGPISNKDNAGFSTSLESFANKFSTQLAKSSKGQNIIYSPFSIQTCVAMASLGAEGETAAEMNRGLSLNANNDEITAKNFRSILSTYEDSKILKIANKMYIMKDFEVQDKFNELLTQNFFTSAENIDFNQSTKAAQTINSWVESKTNNLIKNLVSDKAFNEKTRLVLLNAIYFKGEWEHAFPESGTSQQPFYISEKTSVEVPMMSQRGTFRYADLPQIEAAVLEMPYKDSDLSMLIFLPNAINGLGSLRQKLQTVSLHEIMDQLYSSKVIVNMPKFKTEYEMELTEILKKLGMERMFSKDAEFGKLLKSPEMFAVSNVLHKAFIEVNEKGTEAAAATGIFMVGSLRPGPPEIINHFIVNHGFYYMIVNKDGVVFFQGAQSHI
ncbi:serine protease inhibitor 42Dd isoform X2 [Stomoxys calcitrans]|uniref:serine protease inhibitor 42Dd isoform X2 n=1 Tax=Stomoxys calcitrans TaxID=35570 RepID=UPI0027E2B835|nr:serine protease inhibitor 42Dd isoform X2 [Stomoxys calcitrans]